MTSLRPVLVVLPRPRRPWRALGLLTLFVTAAHLLLMGLMPAGNEPQALPLAQRFSTRTIVIAPPAATGGGSPAATAAPAATPAGPAPTARLRAKPREPAPVAKAPPKPKPAPPPPPPAPEPDTTVAPAEPVEVTPDPPSDPRVAEADPAAASGAPAAGPALGQDALVDGGQGTDASTPGGGGVGTGQGAGEGAGAGAGVAGARVPLKVPPSLRMDFAGTGQRGAQPLSGVFGQLDWLQDGGAYNARLSMKVLFRTIFANTSVGRIGPGGLEPSRYSETRRSEVATHFVRDKGQIIFSSTTTPVALAPGAQDYTSVMMQVAALLAGDPEKYGPGASFSMQTAGSRDASVWSFTVDGDETLDVPAGSYKVRKLTRQPRQPNDRKIELWLAPQLDWVPVRIRQTEPNGDWYDLQLRHAGPP